MSKRKPSKKEILANFVTQCLVSNYPDSLERITIAALNLRLIEHEGTSYKLTEKQSIESDIQKQCWAYAADWAKEDCVKDDLAFIDKVNKIVGK
jgi:hypothetical protein